MTDGSWATTPALPTSALRLHTERADSGDIDRGIAGALAGIKRLAEAGPAPGPAS